MASFLTAYFAGAILNVQMNSAGDGRSTSLRVTDATAEYLPFTSFRLWVTLSKRLWKKIIFQMQIQYDYCLWC